MGQDDTRRCDAVAQEEVLVLAFPDGRFGAVLVRALCTKPPRTHSWGELVSEGGFEPPRPVKGTSTSS